MKNYLIACLLLLAFGCKRKDKLPEDIIPPEKMEVILWDVIRADAYTQEYIKKDETKNPFLENAALQKRIFSLHGIKREDFTRSYIYYTQKPEIISGLLDSMIAVQIKSREDARLRLQ